MIEFEIGDKIVVNHTCGSPRLKGKLGVVTSKPRESIGGNVIKVQLDGEPKENVMFIDSISPYVTD